MQQNLKNTNELEEKLPKSVRFQDDNFLGLKVESNF